MPRTSPGRRVRHPATIVTQKEQRLAPATPPTISDDLQAIAGVASQIPCLPCPALSQAAGTFVGGAARHAHILQCKRIRPRCRGKAGLAELTQTVSNCPTNTARYRLAVLPNILKVLGHCVSVPGSVPLPVSNCGDVGRATFLSELFDQTLCFRNTFLRHRIISDKSHTSLVLEKRSLRRKRCPPSCWQPLNNPVPHGKNGSRALLDPGITLEPQFFYDYMLRVKSRTRHGRGPQKGLQLQERKLEDKWRMMACWDTLGKEARSSHGC